MIVLILHGIDGQAGEHWQQWLHDNLSKKNITVHMPQLPDAKRPSRKKWLQTVKQLLKKTPPNELVIVGHSLGVVTALDLLEELESPVHRFVSISGMGKDYGAELNSYFLKEKEINFEKVAKNITNINIIFGNNDPYVPAEALQHLADALKVKPRIIKNGGHLNTDAGYTIFPELLKIVLTTTPASKASL